MANEQMTLRDAIEYIRNDEAYVAARAAADSYEAIHEAAVAARNWITALGRNGPMPEDYHSVVARLNEALGPEGSKESK